MAYAEFPKMMRHPGHKPAVLSRDVINPNGTVTKAAPGLPEKFPDVWVNNEDQEKQYASLGYLPNGVSDPRAYHAAMAGAAPPSGHRHIEYPRWLYRADENGEMQVTRGHDVHFLRAILVKSEKEHAGLKGWYPTPAEAIEAGQGAETDKDEPQEASPPVTGRRQKGAGLSA